MNLLGRNGSDGVEAGAEQRARGIAATWGTPLRVHFSVVLGPDGYMSCSGSPSALVVEWIIRFGQQSKGSPVARNTSQS